MMFPTFCRAMFIIFGLSNLENARITLMYLDKYDVINDVYCDGSVHLISLPCFAMHLSSKHDIPGLSNVTACFEYKTAVYSAWAAPNE